MQCEMFHPAEISSISSIMFGNHPAHGQSALIAEHFCKVDTEMQNVIQISAHICTHQCTTLLKQLHNPPPQSNSFLMKLLHGKGFCCDVGPILPSCADEITAGQCDGNGWSMTCFTGLYCTDVHFTWFHSTALYFTEL